MHDELVIDGSHGEGGGQILRTSLALSAITGRALRIENIRARRANPGLAAQHLTSVRAVAALCDARVRGDEPGSQTLVFVPQGPPRSGDYLFDVAEAREGGSAGAVTLVLQAVLLPLAVAPGDSVVIIRGGTHVAWSPPFDYARDVWLPTLAEAGVTATLELTKWGWYPAGGGEVRATIRGTGASASRRGGEAGQIRHGLRPLTLPERGELRLVWGRAVAANLRAHIPQRMADRARAILREAGIDGEIKAERVRATSPGAGIFLTVEYENVRAGFSTLGALGKPSEEVAEEAVAALIYHRESGAAFDEHLADQMIVPLAVAAGDSVFSVERITRHFVTNAWVVEQFGIARIDVERHDDGTGTVTVYTSDERSGNHRGSNL